MAMLIVERHSYENERETLQMRMRERHTSDGKKLANQYSDNTQVKYQKNI